MSVSYKIFDRLNSNIFYLCILTTFSIVLVLFPRSVLYELGLFEPLILSLVLLFLLSLRRSKTPHLHFLIFVLVVVSTIQIMIRSAYPDNLTPSPNILYTRYLVKKIETTRHIVFNSNFMKGMGWYFHLHPSGILYMLITKQVLGIDVYTISKVFYLPISITRILFGILVLNVLFKKYLNNKQLNKYIFISFLGTFSLCPIALYFYAQHVHQAYAYVGYIAIIAYIFRIIGTEKSIEKRDWLLLFLFTYMIITSHALSSYVFSVILLLGTMLYQILFYISKTKNTLLTKELLKKLLLYYILILLLWNIFVSTTLFSCSFRWAITIITETLHAEFINLTRPLRPGLGISEYIPSLYILAIKYIGIILYYLLPFLLILYKCIVILIRRNSKPLLNNQFILPIAISSYAIFIIFASVIWVGAYVKTPDLQWRVMDFICVFSSYYFTIIFIKILNRIKKIKNIKQFVLYINISIMILFSVYFFTPSDIYKPVELFSEYDIRYPLYSWDKGAQTIISLCACNDHYLITYIKPKWRFLEFLTFENAIMLENIFTDLNTDLNNENIKYILTILRYPVNSVVINNIISNTSYIGVIYNNLNVICSVNII